MPRKITPYHSSAASGAAKSAARQKKILRLVAAGYSYTQIGGMLSPQISRQRVGQIVHGKASDFSGDLERSVIDRYGCGIDEVIALNSGKEIGDRSGMAYRYSVHRSGAKARNIEWRFTFKQWLDAFGEHIHSRGARGHVMCRKGDAGPYSPDNVYIATKGQNVIDGWKNGRHDMSTHGKRKKVIP